MLILLQICITFSVGIKIFTVSHTDLLLAHECNLLIKISYVTL